MKLLSSTRVWLHSLVCGEKKYLYMYHDTLTRLHFCMCVYGPEEMLILVHIILYEFHF